MPEKAGRRNKRKAGGSWNLEVTRSCRESSRKSETAGSQRQQEAEDSWEPKGGGTKR